MTPGMERLWILAYRWERRLQRSADWCVETPWLPRWPCWPLANALNALSTAPHDWCVRYPAYRRRCLAHWSQRLTVLAQDRRNPRRWTGITEAFGTLGRRHRMTLTGDEEMERRAFLIVRDAYIALQHGCRTRHGEGAKGLSRRRVGPARRRSQERYSRDTARERSTPTPVDPARAPGRGRRRGARAAGSLLPHQASIQSPEAQP